MIYVLSGGGSRATLTVTSTGAGTITISNALLGKSYSKTVAAGGTVKFQGLKSGTWTVKLSDGTQTTTQTITITADYSMQVSYFSATISITYPAKSNCVVKNSSGTTVASNTNTGASAKTWEATVTASGTYTITATATDGSGKTKSTTISITATGQSKSVSLNYGLYLFKAGTGILTGYSVEKLASSGNFNRTDYIEWAATSQTDVGNEFQFQPAVDFSKYKTLYVDLQCTGRYSSSQTDVVIAITEKFRTGESISTWDTLSKVSRKTDSYNTNRHTVSIDVTAITSSSYVTIRAFGISGKLYNVWLE